VCEHDTITTDRLCSLLRGVAGALPSAQAEAWRDTIVRDRLVERYLGTDGDAATARLLQTLRDDARPDPATRLMRRALFMHELLTLPRGAAPCVRMADMIDEMGLNQPGLQPFCFRNPLGFYTFYLFLAKDIPDRIRMHIWPHGRRVLQDEQLQIHNHRTPFRSWVVLGSLIDETFEVRRSESSTPNTLYKIIYQAFEDSVMQNTHIPVVCTRTGARHIAAGQDYVLDEQIYHHTEVSAESYTVTIFHAQPSATYPEPFVVGPRGGSQFHFDRFDGIGPTVVESVLDQLASRLGRG
jgi:hypothetical protein